MPMNLYLSKIDHMLRKIDKYISFEFIGEKVKPLYCEDNGRPAIVLVILFKMIFLGYFYGIRSERRLEQDIQTKRIVGFLVVFKTN